MGVRGLGRTGQVFLGLGERGGGLVVRARLFAGTGCAKSPSVCLLPGWARWAGEAGGPRSGTCFWEVAATRVCHEIFLDVSC